MASIRTQAPLPDKQPDKVNYYLEELCTSALSAVSTGDHEHALHLLGKSQELLEAMKAQGQEANPDYVLLTLHNSAYCYQKSGTLEECASYLDACIYNVKDRPTLLSFTDMKNSHAILSNCISKRRYECRLRLQLCAILSQLNKHEVALSHAQEAARLSQLVVKETITLCLEFANHQKKLLNKSGSKLSDTGSRSSNDVFRRAFGMAQYLDSFISGKTSKGEVEAKFYPAKSADWIMHFNIGDMMSIKPISLNELCKTQTMLAELTTDAMLDKALLMIISYFCIATELRFKFSQDKHLKKLKEGQAWHLQSIDIAKDLLPRDCALMDHLKESYKRNYLEILNAIKKKAKEKEAKAGKVDISMIATRSKSPLTNRDQSKSRSPSARSTSAKNTRRYFPKKPEAPQTPKLFSSRQSKNRVLKPFGLSPLSSERENKSRSRNLSQSERSLKELVENTSKGSTASRILQTRLVKHRTQRPVKLPAEETSFMAPIDRYFMDSFILTSSALYGVSSDDDEAEAVILRREESVEIKETVAVPSTGGRESMTEVAIPRKVSSSIKLLQKQTLRRDSGTGGN
mmetsp:Transcript_3324/g.6891  ORF Transcript_3324/g.6891 Transcript_3324/m.6891 type:complete len:573 (-) Transcript_3324:20-1738(-)